MRGRLKGRSPFKTHTSPSPLKMGVKGALRRRRIEEQAMILWEWILGWILVGLGVLCFLIGTRGIFEIQVLRAEAGDIVLWGFRRPLNWLKRVGFISNYASNYIKLVKERKGDRVENLRAEATHIGIETTWWLAASAFFASIGGILINLANAG